MPNFAHRAAMAAPVAAAILLSMFTATPSASAYLNDNDRPPLVIASPGVQLSYDSPAVRTKPAPVKPEQLLHASSNPTKLGNPLAVLNPTSSYGYRVSPITGAADEFHTGQDYGAPCGTDVLASAAGTVVFSGWHGGGGGLRVEVQHPNGLKTTYSHLAGSAVVEGQTVKRGQAVAAVGSTGASTGCHLHYEVWVNGSLTNPLEWLS